MIYAHAGGWDEILLFALPVLILLVGIGFAERRRKRQGAPPDSELQPTTIPPRSEGEQ